MTSGLHDFIAGCAGGIAQVIVGQPFDIVKVRLQAASAGLKAYNGALDCFKKIVRYEGGPLALWKGTLPPLAGVGAGVSIQFGVNEKTKKLAKRLTGMKNLEIPHLFGCGVIAGLTNAIVSIPVEHCRIRMQIQENNRLGALSCVKKIVKDYGIRGMYKGGVPTLLRDGISFGIYFSVYEWIIRLLNKNRENSSAGVIATAGGISGITLWLVTFPIDMIKTKIQTDGFNNPLYKGTLDCLKKTYNGVGLKGFYRGLSPCLLRAAPVNGATFVAYEHASKFLKKRKIFTEKYQFI